MKKTEIFRSTGSIYNEQKQMIKDMMDAQSFILQGFGKKTKACNHIDMKGKKIYNIPRVKTADSYQPYM